MIYISRVYWLYLSVKSSFERESRFINLRFLFNRSLESNALKGNIVLQWRKPNARLDINPTLFSFTTSLHQAVRGGSDEGGITVGEGKRRGGSGAKFCKKTKINLLSSGRPRCSFVRVEHSVATLCFCSMARAIHSLSNSSAYLSSPLPLPLYHPPRSLRRLATGSPILSGFVSTPVSECLSSNPFTRPGLRPDIQLPPATSTLLPSRQS